MKIEQWRLQQGMHPLTGERLPNPDEPIPYKLNTPNDPDDHYGTRRKNRLLYASTFMVAFGLGTIFGLVLSCWP